ncbi:hypothetical protein FQA39_LY05131 [Lamprigera yunnana]|nr:hypothetical protein FQA39_LY05131 [Lamprigera yunnana]
MDFYDKIRKFLGFSTPNNHDNNIYVPENRDSAYGVQSPDEYEKFGFSIFSNPLEMHSYFERQMNEMMKNFGIFNNDSPFFGDEEALFGTFKEPSFFGFSEIPDDGGFHENPNDGQLRDKFLKPGYEEPPNQKHRADSDLDNQYKSGNFNNHSLVPKSPTMPSKSYSFGKSVMSKTIINSDGAIETHKTIQDQDGNKEVTITHKQGNKEHTVITRSDKNGVQEVVENLINLDENEKDTFMKNKSLPILDENKPTRDESIFTKLFRL